MRAGGLIEDNGPIVGFKNEHVKQYHLLGKRLEFVAYKCYILFLF